MDKKIFVSEGECRTSAVVALMVNKELLFHSFVQQICVYSLERGGICAKHQDIRVTRTNMVSHSPAYAGGERWARASKYADGSHFAERDIEGNEAWQWQGEWSPHGRDFFGQRHRRSHLGGYC